ncbi:putative AlkP superfamily pyrophosphatase or phosphodiesterase [Pedobacter sp. CG_S7]|uniref:alkaline phosphatase PafA n=1 Tax=Pedobacter sp. CG_S7 TaxID=3143930 RepID=UPI00339291C9
MKKSFLQLSVLLLLCIPVFAQTKVSKQPATAVYPTTINRPKLVVGFVVDQMRWDYLYRYYERYGDGGFKRLINEGFSAENTFIPYLPTITACGHASIYTGSVPAINGIIGNNWFDPQLGRDVYCTEDKEVKTVGSTSDAGEMSPKNLLTNTITDELKLATNFKSKVIGISLKDRGAILPAGHSANGAYWYDGASGNWITSTYYRKDLPTWVSNYNDLKKTNEYLSKDWNTLYPINTYTQSTTDDKPYEGKFKGATTSSFPHVLKNAVGNDYGLIRSTPYGNTMTLDLAKKAISGEKLGQGEVTDFLAVSCSSTDYVGHQFGPNSIEAEDTYLRLDKDLQEFLNYLDKTVGKGNYLFFLTSDHGAVQVPGFLVENKIPAGTISSSQLMKDLNLLLEKEFNIKKSISALMNYQVIFNQPLIRESKGDFDKMKETVINYLKQQTGILDAGDLTKINSATLPEEVKKRVSNGYNARRSGDVYFVLNPNWFSGGKTGTSHSTWYPYDSHIPLVFMGWKVKPGKTNKNYYMSDIAATLAAMLHIQMPNGSLGTPITELTHN